MKAKRKRPIRDGAEFNHLFKAAKLGNHSIHWKTDIKETLNFISKVVQDEVEFALPLAKTLQGKTELETARRIWDFVYWHIQYEYDEEGREQIRSFLRSWHDRLRGCDCDDYTTFISTLLLSLKIPHFYRVTKYWDEFGAVSKTYQHIYPVMISSQGEEIIIDDVMETFNEEAPYAEKWDFYPPYFKALITYQNNQASSNKNSSEQKYKTKMLSGFLENQSTANTSSYTNSQTSNNTNMELEYLNGLDNPNSSKPNATNGIKSINTQKLSIDQMDLMGVEDFFKIEKSEAQNNEYKDLNDLGKLKLKERFKNFGKKVNTVVHAANKFNPATLLLRLGVLASMKLNMLGVASNLRHTYLSNEEAKNRGFNSHKFGLLKNIFNKTEDIYYAAGGQKEALKKAILEGKGNSDNQVAGLGEYKSDESKDWNANMPLRELLSGYSDAKNMYQSENENMEGLGEPATATAIAAASSAIALIAGLIKQLGNLKSKDNSDNSSQDGSVIDPNNINAQGSSNVDRSMLPPFLPNPLPNQNSNQNSNQSQNQNLPMPPNNSATNDSANVNSGNFQDLIKNSSEEGFFTKAKDWIKANPLKAAGIGVGLLTAGILIYNQIKESSDNKNQSPNRKSKSQRNSNKNGNGFSGFSSSGRHSKKWKKRNGKKTKRKNTRYSRNAKQGSRQANHQVNEIALF
jgi:hypothetical protein